ncbi:glycosyltransferase family 4 protein [Euhalothece natronophila Z-M001]|uniref:Glycosyltransferase family 4 protein n=1 Tax=Euhalothece natronophila Z-M001 TaxID=522448 RepID=A0A5B8NN85_9CHRO|nr:glycosyltransferase family 4 protein [Euhalothece natronophila]QDZ40366.1 glycosyltransferase family 4 protein [Euhalothece natronophila Z-M001]
MISSSQSLSLLFLSTPVGVLGTGEGGGVELTIKNLAQDLLHSKHQVNILAPKDSYLENIPIETIPGNLQVAVQGEGREAPIRLPANSVLANMCDYARQVQSQYDLIVNFAYDWLPFYLTPFFQTPIAHFISMGSMSEALDEIMRETASRFPNTLGVYTKTQAETFPFADACRCLGSGLDLSLYEFSRESNPEFVWLGRIAPEKGLEDAVAAAEQLGVRLKIFGLLQDQTYWHKILESYPHASIHYGGFLPTHELQQEIRQCRGLLMTPRWVEAFGNVAIEALACGVPVISYRRGGPAEIIQDGKTGFLVEPDSVEGLIKAMKRIGEIDRWACRQQAEAEYSLPALRDRFLQWFNQILTSSK